MKTLATRGILLFTLFLALSCGGNRYANTGTATDRTGTNGATNGNGKAPTTNAHKVNY